MLIKKLHKSVLVTDIESKRYGKMRALKGVDNTDVVYICARDLLTNLRIARDTSHIIVERKITSAKKIRLNNTKDKALLYISTDDAIKRLTLDKFFVSWLVGEFVPKARDKYHIRNKSAAQNAIEKGYTVVTNQFNVAATETPMIRDRKIWNDFEVEEKTDNLVQQQQIKGSDALKILITKCPNTFSQNAIEAYKSAFQHLWWIASKDPIAEIQQVKDALTQMQTTFQNSFSTIEDFD